MEEAKEAFIYGTGLNPYSHEAYYYLAGAYEELGEHANAYRAYVNSLRQEMTKDEEIRVLFEFALFCETHDYQVEAEQYWTR